VSALGELTGIENAVARASPLQQHLAAVQVRWLAGLDPVPHVVRHPVELSIDGDAALADLEHRGMNVVHGVQAVSGLRDELAEECGAVQVGVQRETAHQGAVHEELSAVAGRRLHQLAPSSRCTARTIPA
jgi:hypothetical protein